MHESNPVATWKPIPGFGGYYEVSDHGEVRSVDRIVYGRDGHTKRRRGMLIRSSNPQTKSGKPRHPQMGLSVDGVKFTRALRELVLEVFIGARPAGTGVCHKDGDVTNNFLANLRWATDPETSGEQATELGSSQERWLPVVGYEGFYEVSELGRVRSVGRIVPITRHGRPSSSWYEGMLIRQQTASDGRLFVGLSIDGQKVKHLVHKLVLAAFVGLRPEGMVCCHNDGNHLNNKLSNLRWDTQSNNNHDMRRHGTSYWINKRTCPRDHLLEQPNLIPSQFKVGGRRSCLACSRARSAIKHRAGDLKSWADKYYQEIMRGVAVS